MLGKPARIYKIQFFFFFSGLAGDIKGNGYDAIVSRISLGDCL